MSDETYVTLQVRLEGPVDARVDDQDFADSELVMETLANTASLPRRARLRWLRRLCKRVNATLDLTDQGEVRISMPNGCTFTEMRVEVRRGRVH